MAQNFCWVELLTGDVDAAENFYGEVFGWVCKKPGAAERDYRVFFHDGDAVAGLMTLPEEALHQGARPSWFGYIESPEIDAEVQKISAEGGALYRPPETLPKIGRFAVVADPQGAAFALWKDLTGIKLPEPERMKIGRVGWRELLTDDVDKAFAFYARHFGWTEAGVHDLGALGAYKMFAAGGAPIGGMFKRPAEVPQSFWNYYFVVGDLDAALEKAVRLGAKIAHEPAEAPGGLMMAQCFDPQGAFFSLVMGPKA